MSLLDKLRASGSIKATTVAESSFFNDRDMVTTDIPAINIALGGDVDGGLTPGLLMIAGPSKVFKTAISLKMVSSYMKKYPDSICLYYDTEFGSTPEYFETFGIDTNRILHIPLEHLEQLKFDIVKRLDTIKRGEKVVILIDSVGNIASKKEVEDAESEKSVGDMSRAKQMKSLWRLVTPHLTLKDLPLIAINHTYQSQEMYSKTIVSGGCLVPGTKVQSMLGTKNIEDFVVGDVVPTKIGPQVVTNVWNPDTLINGEPECYSITFEDGYVVECSADHQFLVDGEWVRAADLVAGLDVETLATENTSMKITKVENIGTKKVYDISVENAEHYVLENGVVTHNTGGIYSANTIWVISKAQEKDSDDEIIGYKFTINIEKSRTVKERSKISLHVNFDSGINKYSGLLELALESGDIIKPKNGWYQLVNTETGEMIGNNLRASACDSDDVLGVVLNRPAFKQFVKNKYRLAYKQNSSNLPEEEEDDI